MGDNIDKYTRVFVNGNMIGIHGDPLYFSRLMRLLKRNSFINILTSVTWDIINYEIHIFTDEGRLYRPLLVLSSVSDVWNHKNPELPCNPLIMGDFSKMASLDMMTHGLMPLGVFPIAWIAENEGAGIALVASGIAFLLLIAFALVVFSSVRRTLRH